MIIPALSRRTPLADLWLTEGDGVDVVADLAMLAGVTSWPDSTTLVLGTDSWPLSEAVVDGSRAVWTLTPTEADEVPVGVEAGRLQVGAGLDIRPVLAITAHRTPPNSGKAAGFSSVPVVVVGPPGPTAVSADADNAASLGTDGLIYVAPGAGTVSSVNGQTGAVVLTIPDSPDDIGAATAAQGAKADTASQPGHAHAQSDVTGLVAALAGKADAGHTHTGVYAPALGADDNYVTDAEKAALHSHSNKAALDLVSGTNTGDQDLSTLVPKSLVDAKGDLIVGTAADTVARLAVGTDGQVLTADAASAGGVKWAAGGGGSDPWTYLVATSDTGEASAVETNISGLSVSNLADGLYEFRAMVIGTSAATGVGAQVGMVAPAGCTVTLWSFQPNGAPVTGSSLNAASIATVNASVSIAKSLNAPSSSASFFAGELRGIFRAASMSGALAVTIKAESASQVYAKADSFLAYRRIAS